jgi:hypothetical protein
MNAALLKDTSFSDFKIVCGGKTSDVLKTMLLSKDWSENQEDTLKIEGFKQAVVEKVNFKIDFKWK